MTTDVPGLSCTPHKNFIAHCQCSLLRRLSYLPSRGLPTTFSSPLSRRKPIGLSQVRPRRSTIARAGNCWAGTALVYRDGAPRSPRAQLHKQRVEGKYNGDGSANEEEDGNGVPQDMGGAFGGGMVVYGGGTGAFGSGTTRGFGGWERTPSTMRMAGKGAGESTRTACCLLTPADATVNESRDCCGCWGCRRWRWQMKMAAQCGLGHNNRGKCHLISVLQSRPSGLILMRWF